MNLLVLLLWFAMCADQDARSRRVSNLLTFAGMLVALGYLLISGSTWLGAPASEGGWALLMALALTLPGYALGRLGAGDVKLLIALALATDTLHLLGTFVGAGVVTALWLLTRQKIWPLFAQGVAQRYVQLAPQTSNKQPFVPFLLAGFALTVLFLR
jgi:prepilin peptidase CpaA